MADGNTQTELIDKMQPTDELTEAQHMDLFFFSHWQESRLAANLCPITVSADHRLDESQRKLIMMAGDAACSFAVRGGVHVVRQHLEGLCVLR